MHCNNLTSDTKVKEKKKVRRKRKEMREKGGMEVIRGRAQVTLIISFLFFPPAPSPFLANKRDSGASNFTLDAPLTFSFRLRSKHGEKGKAG